MLAYCFFPYFYLRVFLSRSHIGRDSGFSNKIGRISTRSGWLSTVYHLLVKNKKGEGRLKREGGGPLNFHPQKGGVIWEGGLNRGFMVNKIRSREVERREEERRGEEICSHVLPLPSPSCACYAGYTWVQRVVHALNWSVYGRFLP